MVSSRQGLPFGTVELPLADHVHGFDTGDYPGSRTEVFESEHRPSSPFDGVVILLNKVIQILRLAQFNGLTYSVDQAMGSLLAPLLSMVIFSGTSCSTIARSKNRGAAALSRLAVSRKSTVWPSDSMARYRYFY